MVLFFVLSGFVLDIVFQRVAQTPYLDYAWKRFCRIYIPFAAAILLAALLTALAVNQGVAGLSEWFHGKSWTDPVSFELIVAHLSMDGIASHSSLNNVMWSLVHEMRISLAFPLVMLVVLRGVPATLAAIAIVLLFTELTAPLVTPDTLLASLNATLYYSTYFAAGALLSVRRDDVARRASEMKPLWVLATIAVCVTLLAVPPGIKGSEFLFGIASVVLIALGANVLQRFLNVAPLVWLRRVSFSLYLVHLLILLATFRIFDGVLSPLGISLLVIVVSLAATELCLRLVEMPAMSLGRRLPLSKAKGAPFASP
ncbi:Peptidoglycan/LPS O-acetylase OafA/YrhL, contains acyltransferase and SGNH-hydrolase domains [Aureimonas phyllosphaerae]|uniref:Peptidoglycan/LPS O-acetylase OafA/YrhL n=1 Tax=Aureimonas phyllosphaerae TaxID=1166078 RepID=A0A7W6FWA5_9HYPH|nr:peptidoglycan/LPS O-acetylase OafA/YrhL [Aureimonas phyllosphaerae]MBB3962035.1 peptidoglycan/LPS O-acetylase OafA/YrhL [Aureimonas phyllosphaerae]SFF54103.1 Peptidoglycan/LPS O-acetylase OafA/YrhL, contains acyltransferase and SGNH-hydrolase domains [Aureimonas phyllosphaerae]